eukprot:TRINITY_DN9244_c0_g1_i1.p1 TRINITY_DN9244_c0_g1~~TRINITY_DN9244_c0_g1_i1.p1  ORF type:complete len:256 (-),score=55.31 TRINITY_DN9244_c0_g1_i1:53-778(-)
MDSIFTLLSRVSKPHPVHGLDTHPPDSEEDVIAFIEQAPGDPIKFEVHKASGYLMVDRPHKFSSLCPTIYGFVPKTHCAEKVAARCMEATGKKDIIGDGDPLDICVLSTRTIDRGDLILTSRVIGGFRMIDGGEADDKIIAVVRGDAVMSEWNDIGDIPAAFRQMIHHFFKTYKENPEKPEEHVVDIAEIYGREEALRVIAASKEDYVAHYGNPQEDFKTAVGAAIRKIAAEVVAEQQQQQ